jgi:soluble lytic murein transglycosylase-like protein
MLLVGIQSTITQVANQYGVPPEIAIAVARRESNFNQNARGSSGEVGMFQLMPATAGDLGVDPSNLNENIDGGIRYLRQQFDSFGSWDLALAAYNAGPGNVRDGFIPHEYVDGVLADSGYGTTPRFTVDVVGDFPTPWETFTNSTPGGIPLWVYGIAAGAVAAMVIRR